MSYDTYKKLYKRADDGTDTPSLTKHLLSNAGIGAGIGAGLGVSMGYLDRRAPHIKQSPMHIAAMGALGGVTIGGGLGLLKYLASKKPPMDPKKLEHLKSIGVVNPEATYKKLHRPAPLSVLMDASTGLGVGTLAGAVYGAYEGRGKWDNIVQGASKGLVMGGGIGILSSVLANKAGATIGRLNPVNRQLLGARLNAFTEDEPMLPGVGAYLRGQTSYDRILNTKYK